MNKKNNIMIDFMVILFQLVYYIFHFVYTKENVYLVENLMGKKKKCGDAGKEGLHDFDKYTCKLYMTCFVVLSMT